MKINTSIKTLKGVYETFKQAGISGLLTGEQDHVTALDVMEKLIAGGLMVETLRLITNSENYVDPNGIETPFDEVPYSIVNEILTDFFVGIGSISTLAQK